MNLISKLFGNKNSLDSKDYPKIIAKWDAEGEEYGPYQIEELYERKQGWSRIPDIGRFENEKKWRKFTYFLKIADKLPVTEELAEKLTKHNVKADYKKLTYNEATDLLEAKRKEIKSQKDKSPATDQTKKQLKSLGVEFDENINRIDAKKLLDPIKGQLPATKQTIKKLEGYGIKIPDNLTRDKASQLIYEHEQAKKLEIVIDKFIERGLNILNEYRFEDLLNLEIEETNAAELLIDFDEKLSNLNQIGLDFKLPERLDISVLYKLNNKMEEALYEIEDAESQLEDKEIYTDNGEFKVVGTINKTSLKNIKEAILHKSIVNNWNFERDIEEIIIKHCPKVKLREIDY